MSKNPSEEAPPLGSYRIEESIGFLVGRLKTVMLAELDDQLADLDITSAQWIILMRIANGCGRTGAALCRGMHYDTGSMTRMLDRLEEKSLIRRHRSEEDRRIVELALTEQGVALYPRLRLASQRMVDRMVGDIPEVEVEQFKDTLRRMLINLGVEGIPG
jgi:MarR family transcriptional regulator, multiple antibiotic resistance protein MarR